VRRRSGFTLVEVLVSLTLTGVVMLAAHRIVVALHQSVERLGEGRAALDREANARWLLTRIVAGIDVDQGVAAFRGDPDRAAFTTWQLDVSGRAVRRHTTVERQGGALVVKGVHPEPARLFEDVERLDVDYLLELGTTERFVRAWYSEAGPPAALRLRITRPAGTDTVLLLVGPRG
jgi:prepilin-type N-terminal cleavage/methylation domain-containing protein